MGKIVSIWSLLGVFILLVASWYWVNARLETLYENGRLQVGVLGERLGSIDGDRSVGEAHIDLPEPEFEQDVAQEGAAPAADSIDGTPDSGESEAYEEDELPPVVEWETETSETVGSNDREEGATVFSVRIGGWTDRADADAVRLELESLGIDSFPKRVEEDGKSIWTLQAGVFTDRSGAETRKKQIVDTGFSVSTHPVRIVQE